MIMELILVLYGIPEAARLFNLFMDGEMSRLGYARTEIEPCLYFKFVDSGFLYVDKLTTWPHSQGVRRFLTKCSLPICEACSGSITRVK